MVAVRRQSYASEKRLIFFVAEVADLLYNLQKIVTNSQYVVSRKSRVQAPS